jgi:hypothetical protein
LKYFIGPQGWEVKHPSLGRRWIEGGTLIDQALPQWSFVIGQGPPVDAIAFDQECYNMMVASPVNGGLGLPAWSVRYHVAAGITPAASTRMPASYWEERNIDGTAVVRRPALGLAGL